MTDNLDHHDKQPECKRYNGWLATDMAVAIIGFVGSLALLILVSTGVIHQ